MRSARPGRGRRRVGAAVVVIALAVLAGRALGLPGGEEAGRRPAAQGSPRPSIAGAVATAEASGGPSGPPTAGPPATIAPAVPTIAPPVVLDTVAGRDGPLLVPPPARLEVYPGQVSILAGQPLELHTSTLARSYRFIVARVDALAAGGSVQVAAGGPRPGHDYRSRATMDRLLETVRANWPVTDTVATVGWRPGVYLVTAVDSAGTEGRAIFVVRSAVIPPDAPLFVFPAMTYEAYNQWGGANLYHPGHHAVRVSFDRPQGLDDGLGYWDLGDARILAWLQRRDLPLAYTTDDDLAVHPLAAAPRLLILPRHVEYVTGSLRDWVELHVNALGDMNVMSFGADGFYWQVRVATPRTPGAPMDIVCYKSATADPVAALDPALATVRWRDPPLDRAEGAVFGAQYRAVLGDARTRFAMTVTSSMPAALLAGTGWGVGTVIRGLLMGEGDLADAAAGGASVLLGHPVDSGGAPIEAGASIRVAPSGARVFDAGSFAWSDGLAPALVDLGVPAAGFDRFNRNVLAWLGFPTAG